MLVKLSYPIYKNTPVYPSLKRLSIHTVRSIQKGDRKNIYGLTLNTHTGTHIDYPLHVYEERDTKEAIEEFSYYEVAFLDITVKERQIIERKHLKRYESEIKKCDLLLIRTGFGEHRFSDPEKYIKKNPGISEDAAQYLKKTFPALKSVGIDTISIGSSLYPEENHRVHEILLARDSKAPIYIIEDMRLSYYIEKIHTVHVYPLFIGLDGTPCVILGDTR
ncbi:MAG: cyclase family protein [bacterium]